MTATLTETVTPTETATPTETPTATATATATETATGHLRGIAAVVPLDRRTLRGDRIGSGVRIAAPTPDTFQMAAAADVTKFHDFLPVSLHFIAPILTRAE